MRQSLTVTALLLFAACPGDNPPAPREAADLVPASNEVSGWTRSGTLDTTSTATGLTGLLGAAAQPFIDSGFTQFCRQRFSGALAGGPRTIEIRVANMGDSTHARGVFAALASGQTPWTGDNPGREARVRHDSTAIAVDFWSGEFYIWLTVDTGSAPALEAARYFALRVGRKADSTASEPPEPKDAVDLLPSDNEISGWTRSAALRLAENATQLYEVIDGEAQPYIDNGFVKAAFQSYTGTIGSNPVQLDLRVFDMADSTNARNVYAAVAAGTETPWAGPDHPGVEARIDEAQLFSYEIDFWGGKFYVWITIMEKSAAALDVAKLFAANIWAAAQN
jgi:hypothetical protein